ncbi:glutamyl-tRNA amidotransferase subunit A [Sphaerulina musiva SO2202]|uniref:Glutamyl-tRNA amidotransferase subunit A n=1 Tax=Sphaerulina musiva (strain SO2202) TaxID=692275 RepID=N1QJW8_SPHMS|nr:glutamyl-tRNA amidotransferase subunit A [Sphaerulina musiva SO2202]EMF10844.1 glutamyl-tRNA amidotransferase subunit A [Sphaerulina musiva SO2202]
MSQEPFRLTATEALQAFDSGNLTVEVYARSLLDRIHKRDEVVRAWEFLDRERVIEQAKALDQVPREQRGPLHGVAIGVKDVIYTKDMPTQHNSAIYKDSFPAIDAGSVAILRQAGALIFGKTTTTEFAANIIGTKTANPHAPHRTPGGSSSGSGAAVADFQVPLALGTQTGGSTIRPASYNGIYGFKPTWGSVSREGQKIYSVSLDTLGWYGRSVEDLELFISLFAMKDDAVPRSLSDTGVRGLKFGFVKTMVWDQAGEGTRRAFEDGKARLVAAGAEVEEMEFPNEFVDLPAWHTVMLYSDGRVSFLPEYRIGKASLAADLVEHVEEAHGYTRKQYLDACDGIAALRPKWDAIANRYDAVVAPSVPDIAPEGLERTGSAVFQSFWTALHVPIVNVPGFRGEDDMPIGLSLTAARYKDQALLNVAREVGKVWVARRLDLPETRND